MLFRATLIAAAIATGSAVVFAGTPPAHADDQSFLNDLNENHIGTGFLDPLRLGHMVCAQLHAGASPADVAGMTWGPGLDMPGVVAAAQRDLCPDTLH